MTLEEAVSAKCPCGIPAEIIDPPSNSKHYKKLQCSGICGHNKHLDWIKNPDSKNRRSSSKELVPKYSKGYCEICLIDKVTLKNKGRYLEAHHIVEYKDGGTDDRDNIQIVCNLCHTEIHNRRALAK